MEINAAQVAGGSCWHAFPGRKLDEASPEAACLCGLALASRPHLLWQCPATAENRKGLALPTTRVQERLWLLSLTKNPWPRPTWRGTTRQRT